jgi:hypothetical protein
MHKLTPTLQWCSRCPTACQGATLRGGTLTRNGARIPLVSTQRTPKLPKDARLLHLLAVVYVILDPLFGEAGGERFPVEWPAETQSHQPVTMSQQP